MKRIVVGVDGSDASFQAVAFAGRLAGETGAALTVVFVERPPLVGRRSWSAATAWRSVGWLAGWSRR